MDEKPTLFDNFAARRIAEFPTLYSGKDDVISECILGSQGDCSWKNGVLVQPNQHFNKKTEKWTQYPLRMPLATANEFHQYKIPSIGWDIGSARAPISNLPDDADESYLEAIDMFLFRWGRLDETGWKTLAEAHCLIVWQCNPNVHAGEPQRKLDDFLRFMKLVPKWRAAIREIEYFQQHGQVDPKTFQGIDI